MSPFFRLLLPCLLLAAGGCIRAQSLSLGDAIDIAKRQSYEATVARLNFTGQYWSYRSFRAELLPAVNLNGGLFQFNRSMVET
ncbi:MAG: TolC family protein, partial [Bacteroidaceae bacterium]|nr:TolC family protein [Bacteroidaceae bacterium]